MATNEDVLWARHGQQIVARVLSSLKGKRRSFEGYRDQLGAHDVTDTSGRPPLVSESLRMAQEAQEGSGRIQSNVVRFVGWLRKRRKRQEES